MKGMENSEGVIAAVWARDFVGPPRARTTSWICLSSLGRLAMENGFMIANREGEESEVFGGERYTCWPGP